MSRPLYSQHELQPTMLLQSSISPPPFPSNSNYNNNNMDQFSHIPPTERSPRRELQLQGPRPTPLRISKDSHKIKKPPLAPQPSHPQPPPRQPIIIYTVSPKVIHTTPSDFMNLVQRLTGSNSSSSEVVSNNNNTTDPFNNGSGMVSPAARYATIEKAMSPMGKKQVLLPSGDNIITDVEGIEILGDGLLERSSQSMFQGILSPGPASLSPIPSNFFSPPSSSDPGMVSFLHDLSPMFQSGRNFTEAGSFVLPSPSSNFSFVSPHTPSIDLFNYFLE